MDSVRPSPAPPAARDTIPVSLAAPSVAPIARIVAGRYRLGKELGRGASGSVYMALQMDLDREVAIKVLSQSEGEGGRERFLREAKLAAEIRHPCVAEVYDAGMTEEGQPFYAMELLEGETLATRLERGALPIEEAVAITAGIASALGAVHAKGFLHRDVKPGNIFLARRADGGVDPKLIDFGIVKRFAIGAEDRKRITRLGVGPGRERLTVANVIVGTPRYVSPEQVTGEQLDARSDVYALSATLYEALSETAPFRADDTAELFGKILRDDPESLARRAPARGVPAPLDAAVLRGLEKRPEDRYATPGDLSAALWSALAEAQGKKVRSDPPAPAPSPARRRGPVLLILAALVLLGVLLFAGLQSRSVTPPAPSAAILATTAPPAPGAAAEPALTGSAEAPPAPTTEASAAPSAPKGGRLRAAASARPSPSAPAAPPPSSFRLDDLKAPF